MVREKRPHTHRYEVIRRIVIAIAVIIALLWTAFWLLQPAPQRRIVMASGNESGIYHQFARRYIEILRRQGVRVEERMTDGAAENLKLLLDPASRVDVAFLQGGVAELPVAHDVVMLASLYYEPLWIFYRDAQDARPDQPARRQAHCGRYTGQRHASSRGADTSRQRIGCGRRHRPW